MVDYITRGGKLITIPFNVSEKFHECEAIWGAGPLTVNPIPSVAKLKNRHKPTGIRFALKPKLGYKVFMLGYQVQPEFLYYVIVGKGEQHVIEVDTKEPNRLRVIPLEDLPYDLHELLERCV